MASTPTEPETKKRKLGPYRLLQRLAVGGMSEVYLALLPQKAGDDRTVVVKRLLPRLAADADQRRMFEREAQLGKRIEHPNVVALIDHGSDGSSPYLVLEYVFGVDLWRLTRYLRQNGKKLPLHLTALIATEMLAGLDAVHKVTDDQGSRLHIVHRDVSPSNLFLSVHGDVKLGDLGIARSAWRESSVRRPLSARTKGKLGYLAPEQVTGGSIDQRTDVFAAAVVVAEMLMGAPLFAGGTEIAILLAIRDGDLSPFIRFASNLTEDLSGPVLKALSRDPSERTPSALALREAMMDFLDGDTIDLRKELGALVVEAIDSEDSNDRSSLAATIEEDMGWLEAEAKANIEEARKAPQFYTLSDEGTRGPYSFADLVKRIATGRLVSTDRIREEHGQALTIEQVPELARYLPVSTRTPTIQQRTQMTRTSEVFDFSVRSALEVFVELVRGEVDGLLLCDNDGVRKEVYLTQGVPEYVTTNRTEELLGETLVSANLIQRSELDFALALMPRFEGRLGETLVALGLIEPVQLFRHLSQRVRERLLALFVWTKGHAALYRGVQRPERAFPLRIDAWELLEAGAARRIKLGLESKALPTRAQAVLLQTDTRLDESVPERFRPIWTACEAPRALSELEGMAPSPLRAQAVVRILLELQALRWHQ